MIVHLVIELALATVSIALAVAHLAMRSRYRCRETLTQTMVEELEQARDLFSGALHASNVDIAILDDNGRILFANEAWRTLAERSPAQLSQLSVGSNYFEIVNAADPNEREFARQTVEGIKSVLDGREKHFELEYPVASVDEPVWYLLTAIRFRTPGSPRVVISHENITERKSAEQRLLNKQEKLRSIYHASTDGILLVNSDGIFDGNEKSVKLLGVESVEQLHGQPVSVLVASQTDVGRTSTEVAQDLLEQALSFREPRCELMLKRADGTEFPAELMLSTFLYNAEQVVQITFRDISDRKLAEEWLQQMNQQLQVDLAARIETEKQIRETSAYLDVYRKIVDTHAIVAETDTTGTIVSVNEAFCKISGYSREELLGKNHRILNSGLHSPEMWRDMYRNVANGGIWHGEICNRAKNGRLYWVDTTIAPLFNENGKVRGYFAIRADITSLKTAQTQAEAASRSKSEFLANMSHEIRTPMTAILGYTDLLAELGTCDHCKLSPQAALAIDTIKRNGEHLLSIINDILDISKIEADKMTVEAMRINLPTLIRETLTTMQVKSQAKGLTLTCELETSIPQSIVTDPTRLRQILVNLIGNAIKFTEHGSVVLKLSSPAGQPGMLCFSVVDSGIGMNAEQKKRLFQAFEQADTSMTRRFGGTGLGLRISKRLAQMLGGDISVESELGSGSCFTLSIATGEVATECIENLTLEADHTNCSPTQKSAKPLVLEGVHILVVEDGPDNQRLITHHLRKAGATVDLASNGKLAVEAMTVDGSLDGILMEPSPFNLILMDMQMPVMDGLEATCMLRKKGATLPIVALTAHAMQADLQMCLDAGCDLRITKPIDREQLIECCRTQVQRATGHTSFTLPSDPAPVAQLPNMI